jgi:hypothetical protein
VCLHFRLCDLAKLTPWYCVQVKEAYDARWVNAHSVLHPVGFAFNPEYLYVDMGANAEVSVDVVKYISIYYGKGSENAAKCLAQYTTFCSGQGIFANESVRACAAHMPAYKWWASRGGTLPELREVALLPCVHWLSQWARVLERGISPPTT